MNIILVDDEPLICEYIKECILKCDSGHKILGCFYRASDALKYLKTHTVHLVITDITMPEMDGLDFAAAVRNEFHDNIDIIMLTCHRNFDFARKAMENSVKNYIIKSEITPEKMKEILSNIEMSHASVPSLKKLSVHYSQSQFLRSFLTDSTKMEISDTDRKTYNITLTNTPYFSLAFPEKNDIVEKISDYEDTRLNNQIIFFNDLSARYLFTANINIAADDMEQLSDCINSLKTYLSSSCSNYIGSSSIHYNLTSLKKSFWEAEESANNAFYGFNPQTLPHERKTLTTAQQEMFSLANKAIAAALNNLSSDYYTYINNFFSYANIKERVAPDYLCSLLSYIIVSTLPLEQQNMKQTYINKMKTTSSFIELKQFFLEVSQKICQTQKTYSKPVEQAVKYINEHYQENITLSDISKYVFLNKEYFCRKFKNEVGSSFTEYRLYIQLKEAFNLLISTTKPINVIAETVGLPNISYFSSVFKKQFGTTPSNIRKEYGKKHSYLSADYVSDCPPNMAQVAALDGNLH